VGRNWRCPPLLAKGQVLRCAGNAWTDELDFANSISAGTERVFVDTQKPFRGSQSNRFIRRRWPLIIIWTAHASLLKPRAGRWPRWCRRGTRRESDASGSDQGIRGRLKT